MARQPLAEVFGFPASNTLPQAERYRANRLCPFNNKVPSCTKDKAEDPLGVCSVAMGTDAVITCPIRFRQDWIIAEQAAAFFFPQGSRWTSLTEVRLNDKHGQSAGNIDLVLVAYDNTDRLTDFGTLEVQAVYISGNVRRPFDYYMQHPDERATMTWSGQVRPDFLSSSRKRLAPQLIYKGGIVNGWGKKQAIAIDRHFFATLPTLDEVSSDTADMAIFVYDLKLDPSRQQYMLTLHRTVYTMFAPSLTRITTAEAGDVTSFVAQLQARLGERLDTGNPPTAPSLFYEPDEPSGV